MQLPRIILEHLQISRWGLTRRRERGPLYEMRRLAFISIGFLAFFTIAAWAQEGHPLSGTWHGDWGPNSTTRNHLVMNMRWEDKAIVGSINPGPRAIPLTVTTLDPEKWTVHFEGTGKDQAGNPVHVVADGKIENLGSYNRTITGTWMQGNVKGDFKLTRD
jgi:hypothetical protein